jgi:hydrogenase maturation protease
VEQPLLVIGVGNRYRQDDGAGIAVVRKLNELAICGLATREESGEGASLIETWGSASHVVIVDAVSSGSAPGTIHRLDALRQSIPADFFHYSSHSFGVAEAIEVARALNALPGRLEILGIEGGEFTSGLGLSPEVERAVDKVTALVAREFHLNAERDRLAFQ